MVMDKKSDLLIQSSKARGRQNTKDYILSRVVIDNNTGCWNWVGSMGTDGYGKAKRAGKTFRAHRLSYEFFSGEIPAGLLVCHSTIQRIISGSIWSHLRLSEKYGLPLPQNVGDRNPVAKLSTQAVLKIRDSTHLRTEELASQYGVTTSTIRNILKRRTWKHI